MFVQKIQQNKAIFFIIYFLFINYLLFVNYFLFIIYFQQIIMYRQDQFIQSFSPLISPTSLKQNKSFRIDAQVEIQKNANWFLQDKNQFTIELSPCNKKTSNSTNLESTKIKKQIVIPSQPKTVEQLKKQLKKKQQRKKLLNNKIKSILNQKYGPIMALDNIKQVNQEWIEMAEIGLNIITDRKQSVLLKNDKDSLFKTLNKNYYQIRNYYDQLMCKNQKNKQFLMQFNTKIKQKSINQKLQFSYSQNLKKQHQNKWQSINSFTVEIINKKNKVKESKSQKWVEANVEDSQDLKKSNLNANLSLLKLKCPLSQSPSLSMGKQTPSLINKINFPTCQKIRQSIFGDLKKSINAQLLNIKKDQISYEELPKILRRYRTMTSKQNGQQQSTQSIVAVSERQELKKQRFKTQNYKFINSKLQINQIKRKRYLMNNVDLGSQIDQQKQQPYHHLNPFKHQQLIQYQCPYTEMSRDNPHKQIAKYSEQSKYRKLQRIAFIEELRQHLKQSSVPRKISFIRQMNKKTQQTIKSPKIVSLSPQKILGERSSKCDKFVTFTNRTIKAKGLKLKKQQNLNNKIFKKEKRSYSCQNPEDQNYLPNIY